MLTLTAYQKWRMCERKRQYHHKKAVKRAASKRGYNYYECPVCCCYHITKQQSAQTSD